MNCASGGDNAWRTRSNQRWPAVSRFRRCYLRALLGGLRHVDLKGLTTVGFHAPELDEVFVDVSLVHQAVHEVPGHVLATVAPGTTDRRRSP